MSSLVEIWSQNKEDPVTRWPCCRTYKTLDAPMTAKVTRIITDPGTNNKREFTSSELLISPLDIRQRNRDKQNAKLLGIFLIVLTIAFIIFSAMHFYNRYKIIKLR